MATTDLCDGCHYEIALCACDELEAEREEEYGPICFACGGAGDDEYANCEFGGSGVYEPGPGSEDSHGCPRVTGTF
jgi:hypothetical protein